MFFFDPRRSVQLGQLGLVLPSANSAEDLVAGKPGSLPRVIMHFAGRAVFIGTGLALAGARDKDLIKYALAGSAAIEAFVLAYAYNEKKS